MATLLTEKMFTNGNSSFLKQHTVRQTFFVFNLLAPEFYIQILAHLYVKCE